ncbi:MAG: hypothetical protein SWH54_16510 [Thermodesulfobacteriota bacterium]|nr:hypothetical protein [Thermodesulfobacteriota bacterium]
MRTCPKCGFEDYQGGPECPKCGIIYEKYYNSLGITETEDQTPQEEEEQSNGQPEEKPETAPEEMTYVEPKPPIEKATDFIKKNYLIIAAGIVLFIVISCVIYCIGSRTVGKTGIASWYNILGEEAQTNLLFDNIDLLKNPVAQEEGIVCIMQSGTRIKVLKEVNDFYKVKVLEGICNGEVGFIVKEHFEEQ